MSYRFRSLLILLAVFVAAADARAARKPGHRPAAHHTAHSKTTRYRRPAVHHRPVPHPRRQVTRTARRPATRKVIRTIRRYPVHRVVRRYGRGPYYFYRPHRSYRRYSYFYYPGRYRWRTSYYNRGYNRLRWQQSRGVRGIVEGVQGNPNNGMLLVKVHRPRFSRFRYGTTFANANLGRSAFSVHRFHVNNGTRYQIMANPLRAGSFASLRKGEQVWILKPGNRSNTAQVVETFPRPRR